MWFASFFLTRRARRRRWARLELEWLLPRNVLSTTLLHAGEFPGPERQVGGTIGPGEVAVCPVTVSQDGRLTAEVTAQGAAPPLLLTLSGPDGQELVSSSASTPTGGPRIVQHLAPGTYQLTV